MDKELIVVFAYCEEKEACILRWTMQILSWGAGTVDLSLAVPSATSFANGGESGGAMLKAAKKYRMGGS